MQNEILKPVLDTDEVAVPRYDIVGPNGSVIQQNVELRLKNEVVQEGTPYDEESVLPASLREQLELPQSATPAEAMAALLTKGGGAVRRNRPPLTTDADQVGKLWVVPEMFFNNLMPNALTQVAGNWQSSNATVAVSGNTATFTGSGTENSVDVQVGMLASAKAGDKIFVQATVKVNHDANAATIQLTCGEQTLATKTLDVPAAGDTMLLQAVATVEASGALVLRVHSAYNTAAVQSGKSLTVKDITVWNLTGDMCEAQEGNEFTQPEAITYISTFGQFQTREYEYSTWWWILRGVSDGVYLWERMFDEATTSEAQAGSVSTSWMSPRRAQEFYTHRIATQSEVDTGTDDAKHVTSKKAHGLFTAKLATTTEAQAGASDAKWMSPLKVKQLLVAEGNTKADIQRYIAKVSASDSGYGYTVTNAFSITWGRTTNSDTSTKTIDTTISLSTLAASEILVYINTLEFTLGGSSSSGSYTGNWTAKAIVGGVTINLGSGTGETNPHNTCRSTAESYFQAQNVYALLGQILDASKSIRLVLTVTPTGGSGFISQTIRGVTLTGRKL